MFLKNNVFNLVTLLHLDYVQTASVDAWALMIWAISICLNSLIRIHATFVTLDDWSHSKDFTYQLFFYQSVNMEVSWRDSAGGTVRC